MKKIRKPRGIKKNGYKSLDLCLCCYHFHCDPMTTSPKFDAKIRRRFKIGVCVACGSDPCKCKSSIFTNNIKLEKNIVYNFLKNKQIKT